MYTTGIDIIEISRIKKSVSNDRFLNCVFSDKELKMFYAKADPYPSMAGNWAAKEAFSKALGTGVRGFSLNEISVLREQNGKPYLDLCGNAEKAAQGLSFSVSISHTYSLATAIVIAYNERFGD